MVIVALKECPQGQLPGTVFDVPAEAGRLLIAVGAAREATAEEADDLAAPNPHSRRGRYRRRDLRADP